MLLESDGNREAADRSSGKSWVFRWVRSGRDQAGSKPVCDAGTATLRWWVEGMRIWGGRSARMVRVKRSCFPLTAA